MTSPGAMRPHVLPNVVHVDVGEERLVFDVRAEQLHRLNHTGGLVWDRCDGTLSVDEIAVELAVGFDRPDRVIRSDVRRIVTDFFAAGLLEQSDPPSAVTGCPDAEGTAAWPDPPAAPVAGATVLGPFRALDHEFVVSCSGSTEVAAELARVLEPLAGSATDPKRYDVWHTGAHWWVRREGSVMRSPTAVGIIGHVVWMVNRGAVTSSDRYLLLHAAAVGLDGSTAVLPAPSNSGKSTLAAALVAAGFEYLTDEAGALDLDSGEVVAFPKSLSIETGSQALLAHLQPVGPLVDPKRWHVPASVIRQHADVHRLPLRHIAFPTHCAGADTQLRPMGTADAVVAMVKQSFNFAAHADRLADLVAVVDGCTRHELDHDGLTAPVAAIRSLW